MKTTWSLGLGILAWALLPGTASTATVTVQAGVNGGGGVSTGGTYVLRGALTPDAGGTATQGAFVLEAGSQDMAPLIVVTPGAPTLVISRQAQGILISWSGGGSGYTLEQTGQINTDWKVVEGGTLSPVAVSIDAVTRYFRLRKP